jgi:hypothetical protein
MPSYRRAPPLVPGLAVALNAAQAVLYQVAQHRSYILADVCTRWQQNGLLNGETPTVVSNEDSILSTLRTATCP